MDEIQKINAAFYDSNAERWTATRSNTFTHELPFRKFLKRLHGKGSVIDIGCASGIHVPLFLGIGRKLKYEGIDISKGLLKIAQAHYPQLGFRYADLLEKKTLPKKKYNAFWAGAVFQHIPFKSWPVMFENVEGLVKHGSLGYLTLPDSRPNSASETDPRYFEIVTDPDFQRYIADRKWKILDRGEFPAREGQAVWRWYIVRVP